MEPIERPFKPPEQVAGVSARGKTGLDLCPQGKILHHGGAGDLVDLGPMGAPRRGIGGVIRHQRHQLNLGAARIQRFEPHRHHMVLLHQQLRRGRQSIEQDRIPAQGLIRLGPVGQVHHRAPRLDRPDIGPKHAIGRQIVREARGNRVAVRDPKVIGLQRRLREELPMRCDLKRSASAIL